MHTTPVRRLAAGATATAILAAAFLIPAAVAAADEPPQANQTIASPADPMPSDETPADPARADETPASEAVASEDATGAKAADAPHAAESAATEPRSTDDLADSTAVSGEQGQLAPTARSTDDPQEPDEGEIAPGETAVFSYPVAGARLVHVYAIGDDLAVTVVRADGSRLPVPSNGSVYSREYYWVGQVDGTWKLEITNTGTSPVTPEYGLTYSTQADQLGLSSSLYAPELWMRVSPTIGGIPRSDLTLQSELIGPDGSRYAQAFTNNAVTYTGLPSGDYFARVWTVVDGVTYQESRTVGVHVAETDPPAVVIGTSPTAPNAAGWFRSVSLNFTGTDAGSGYSATFYTIDGGPETRASNGYSYPLTGDGEHTVRFRGEDHQGNFSDWQESTIRLDATAPTISLHGIAEGGRYAVGEELFVEYQCGDATSGLDGENCTADLPDGARVDTTTPGDYSFTIQASDLAGNTTRIVRSYSVVGPDTTEPVIDIELPTEPASGWFTTSVTAHLTATDESGVTRIHWEIDTDEGTIVREVLHDAAYAIIDVTGVNTLRYWAEDAAGNRSEEQHIELSLDLVAPEITVTSPQGALSILPNGHYAQNERVDVDFDCDDIGSGIASCEATTPDGELLPTGTPGVHELRLVATDVAGHRTERVVTYTVDAAPAPDGGNGGVVGPGAPRLASTGADGLVGGVALAVLLLGAGAVLAIRRRVRTR
jgi:hypothetical protein